VGGGGGRLKWRSVTSGETMGRVLQFLGSGEEGSRWDGSPPHDAGGQQGNAQRRAAHRPTMVLPDVGRKRMKGVGQTGSERLEWVGSTWKKISK
jgi:hypothetical protein